MNGDSIKMRVQLRDGVATVRALIRHPMEVGRQRGSDGQSVPAHFITRVSCEHQGEPVLLAHWGGGVAKNPYLSFSFEGAAPGDTITLRWEDNQGEADSLEFTLPA